MKILEAELVTTSYHSVTTSEGEIYERYSADDWRWVVGECIETIYRTKELEEAFQLFIKEEA